ncbi:MAG: dihydroneopterin aldolase [Proteobacteria bacterium]|nr:dihydroneopterin aldolase [Pseudomonadota bacterium]
MEAREVLEPLKIADARQRIRHVFVRDLVIVALVGIHSHERNTPQRVRFNLDLAVREGDAGLGDDIANVVCYEKLVAGVQAILGKGHVGLVESLAEEVAQMALADRRVRSARVRVEKLDIFDNAESVGVEIERFNVQL